MSADKDCREVAGTYFRACIERRFGGCAKLLYPGDLDKFKTNVLWCARAMEPFGEASSFLEKFGPGIEIEDLEVLSPADFTARFLHGATGAIDSSILDEVCESFVIRGLKQDGDVAELAYAYDPTPEDGEGTLWEKSMRLQRVGERWFVLFEEGMHRMTDKVRRDVGDFDRRRQADRGSADQDPRLEKFALYGYLDKRTREPVIEPRFRDAGEFGKEGIAPVRYFRKWGYIDKAGEPALPPIYDRAGEFCKGLALVAVEDEDSFDLKWGFIDASGHSLTGIKFEEEPQFSQGLAAVCEGGLWGYLNKKGEMVIPFQYEAAEPFQGGRATVWLNSEKLLIDKKGQELH